MSGRRIKVAEGFMVWMMLVLLGCSKQQTEPVVVTEPSPKHEEPAWEQMQTVMPSEGLEADLAATQAFLQGRPIYEQPLGTGLSAPEPFRAQSAETCKACHGQIYEEWAVSTHAQAWKDPQYQAEIQKSGNRWLCLNCHTPLLVQQERWPRGLVDGDVERPLVTENASFDSHLRDEGITCVACHAPEGVIGGPGLEDSQAPHPVVVDARLQSQEICLRCHQATATYPGKTFTCVFNTGAEWAATDYAAEGTTCIDCHMPEVESAVATGGEVRTRRQHWWRGAGIPKFAGVQPPVEANPPGLALRARSEGDELVLELENARAGHTLPSGDPERWIQVDTTFYDAADSALEAAHQVRIGQRWEWYPEPKKLADERLDPHEVRSERLAWPPDAVRAEVVASSHRMSTETAEYHDLLETYPLSVETHRLEVARGE